MGSDPFRPGIVPHGPRQEDPAAKPSKVRGDVSGAAQVIGLRPADDHGDGSLARYAGGRAEQVTVQHHIPQDRDGDLGRSVGAKEIQQSLRCLKTVLHVGPRRRASGLGAPS